jgi:hypothetical protein
MEQGRERRYVLRGTAKLNGTIYLGGTEWTGQPSLVVNDYVSMSWRGSKVLLERQVVENYFREVDAPAARQQATGNGQR